MDSENKHGAGSMQTTENGVIARGADLFSPVVEEAALVHGMDTMYRPLNKSSEGPIEFNIKTMGMNYIDLPRTSLFAQLKITQGNGANLQNNTQVAFVNLPLSSMFKTIDVEIGGALYPHLGNTFAHYKAYLETILSYSTSAQEGHLKASLFHLDTAGHFESFADAENLAYQIRKVVCAGSASFQVSSPVHCDFFQMDKYWPPGNELTFRFHRSSDAFAIMSNAGGANFKIVIEDIKLYIRHITLADSIVNLHIKQFEKQLATFPLNKTELKTSAHPAHLTNLNIPNLFNGLIPKSIIITFVPSANFNGTYGTNPYYFRHYFCNYAALTVNGITIPSDPYKPDFERSLFTREYRDFFDNVGIGHDDLGNAMTPELYAGGMFMIAFDLSPDKCNGFHSHPRSTGNINLDLAFAQATDSAFTVLAFATFDNVIRLDKNSRITSEMNYGD